MSRARNRPRDPNYVLAEIFIKSGWEPVRIVVDGDDDSDLQLSICNGAGDEIANVRFLREDLDRFLRLVEILRGRGA